MLKLRLLTGPRAGRQLRVSDTKPVSVGRRVGRLRLHDTRVSKRHAKIYFANGVWILRDLGSANGTFVNQRRCEGLVELETGDMLQMGRVLIKVMQADAVGMHVARKLPDISGTQASAIGVDAFTASGATGMLPAIDPGKPVKSKQPIQDRIDLDNLFGSDDEDSNHDLIDFSDASRADASAAGTVSAGQTQLSGETIELEPVSEVDPLLEGVEPEVQSQSTSDLVQITDEDIDAEPPKLGSTLLTAIREEEDQEKPRIVGLRLDQQPPKQPKPAQEAATEPIRAATPPPAEPEVEAEPERGLDAELEHDAEFELNAELDLDADLEPAFEIEPEVEAEAQADASAADVENEVEEDLDAALEAITFDALEAEVEAKAEVEAETASQPAVEAAEETEVANEAEAKIASSSEPVTLPDVDDASLRIADAMLTEAAAPGEAEVEALDFETAHAEWALDDVVELEPAPVDPEALAQELWPSVSDATAEAAEPEPEPVDEVETAVEAAIEAEVEAEAKVVAESQPLAEPVAEAPIDADALAALDAAVPQESVADGADAQAIADDASAAPAEQSSNAPPEFDIDAAFDALSQGLDDSIALPAIGEIDDQADEQVDEEKSVEPVAEADEDSQLSALLEALAASEEAASPEPEAALQEELHAEPSSDAFAETVLDADADESAFAIEAEAPDEVEAATEVEADIEPEPVPAIDPGAYAGSQLDVNFIREALAKLGQADPDAPTEPGTRPQISEDVEEVEKEAITARVAEQPITAPPGLNPTSLLPPTEPSRSYHAAGKRRGRWFFTMFLMLIIAGLSGALFYKVYFNPDVAGRVDNTKTSKPAPDANTNTPVTTPVRPKPPIDTTGPKNPPADLTQFNPVIDPRKPADVPQLAGSAPVPDPFASGPGLLGNSAMEGITVGETAGQLPPPPDKPTRLPDIIEQPTLPGTDINKPVTPGPVRVPQIDTPTKPDVTKPDDSKPPVAPRAEAARIVFLVDASGSLVDSLPQMLVWLGEAVRTIGPDERFTVIFFKSGQAIEASDTGLIAPTRDALATLQRDWLNPDDAPVLPTGRSDPRKAIAAALQHKPTDIYLLSDESFARFAGDTTRDQAVKLVSDAVGDAKVKVHGVQFFYRDEGGVLETLANRYEGTFEFVKEAVVRDADPIDLLEELDKNE